MSNIAKLLLPWFDQYGRKDLPWQQNVTPYRVWLSEIMLQQTQVSTVIPYYSKFTNAFATITELANAELDQVLSLWSGLGYYARARNLHKTAQLIRDEFNGEFPVSLDQLESFPGIGRSTAGAILSLSMGQTAGILDGNVKRVLCRLFEVSGWAGDSKTQKLLWSIVDKETPSIQTAAYNQAMMDLGSMVCTRTRPDCERCPLISICSSARNNTQQQYPQSKPKKLRPHRHVWMLFCALDDQVLLYRRPPAGIWGGLWSLPEYDSLEEIADWQEQYTGTGSATVRQHENFIKHRFTHFDLSISVMLLSIPEGGLINDNQIRETGDEFKWVQRNELDQHGLPTPVSKILAHDFPD